MNMPKKFLVLLVAAQGFCCQDIVAGDVRKTTQQSHKTGLLASLTNRNVLIGAGIVVVLGVGGCLLLRRTKLSGSHSSTQFQSDASRTPIGKSEYSFDFGGPGFGPKG